jgi:hypothetical protein
MSNWTIVRAEGRQSLRLLSPEATSEIEARAHLEFINRACNVHEQLLAACKAMAVFFGTYNGDGSRDILEQARAAITKATARQEDKPTTEKIRGKRYRCNRCGFEQDIQTNHYGECYSLGAYNSCPQCGPHMSVRWICCEPCPAEMATPEPWKLTTLGEVCKIKEGGKS